MSLRLSRLMDVDDRLASRNKEPKLSNKQREMADWAGIDYQTMADFADDKVSISESDRIVDKLIRAVASKKPSFDTEEVEDYVMAHAKN